MKVELHHTVSQVADCVMAEVGTDLVVSHLQTGRYVGLNPTARAIWEQIKDPTQVDAICAELLTRYKVDATVCKAQVLQTLDTLNQQGLIQVTG